MILSKQPKVSFNLIRDGTEVGKHDSKRLFWNSGNWGSDPVHLVEEHLDEFIRQRSRVRVYSEDVFEIRDLLMHEFP